MDQTARQLIEQAISELSTFNYKSRVDKQHAKQVIKTLKKSLEKLDDEEPMVQVIESEND